jgi:hypothetical protein
MSNFDGKLPPNVLIMLCSGQLEDYPGYFGKLTVQIF